MPFDPRPPAVSSGLRVGTPALATRGLAADDFRDVGEIIATALTPDFESRRDELRERVAAIAERFPLYAHLGCARLDVSHAAGRRIAPCTTTSSSAPARPAACSPRG